LAPGPRGVIVNGTFYSCASCGFSAGHPRGWLVTYQVVSKRSSCRSRGWFVFTRLPSYSRPCRAAARKGLLVGGPQLYLDPCLVPIMDSSDALQFPDTNTFFTSTFTSGWLMNVASREVFTPPSLYHLPVVALSLHAVLRVATRQTFPASCGVPRPTMFVQMSSYRGIISSSAWIRQTLVKSIARLSRTRRYTDRA